MNIFSCVLVTAGFLSSLMAGFLFAFAVVVMPGIKELGDRDFLGSFRAIDRVIQNSNPLFMTMWLGSTLSLVVAAAMGIKYESGLDRTLLVSFALASVFLIQLPTMAINIPLNNAVQALEIKTLDDETASRARKDFETRWNRWNVIRTVIAVAILMGLLVVLIRT